MEISVSDSKGLPEGCLLSIRAGSTRRQAQIPLTEPFRFPTLPFNSKALKVDILAASGSAKIDIDEWAKQASYTAHIAMNDGQQGRIGFTVREDPALCGKRAAAVNGGLDDAFGQAGGDGSQQYIKRHNVAGVVQEALQYVLREQPKCPYSLMAAYFGDRAAALGEPAAGGRASGATAGAPAPPPAPPAAHRYHPGPAPAHSSDTGGYPYKAAPPPAAEAYKAAPPAAADRSGGAEPHASAAASATLPPDGLGQVASVPAHSGTVQVLSGSSYQPTGGTFDMERMQLEAENVSLRSERAKLMLELSMLEIDDTVAGVMAEELMPDL